MEHSIRKCVDFALQHNQTWLGELIWREFFMQILYHFPKVVSHSFKTKYDFIQWRNDEQEFELWCTGNTGYPIVDAGMRQLNETGYMHNRVRMIVASFLCKHLLIDWRWGEAYFAEKLNDYDLSANNGNWQWAAGCGCDAAHHRFGRNRPFHRIRRRGDPLALDGGTHDGMQHEYRVRRPRRHDRPRPDDLRLPARTRTRVAGRGVRRRRSAVAGTLQRCRRTLTANTGSTPPRSRR